MWSLFNRDRRGVSYAERSREGLQSSDAIAGRVGVSVQRQRWKRCKLFAQHSLLRGPRRFDVEHEHTRFQHLVIQLAIYIESVHFCSLVNG